ncbi:MULTISPECIES: histidine phosphatase family protein [Roseomonadaceae]|uniref:Histidine phosphatase family protein n=1 Tax=Falsiroseomonas oleicola TaxID=2801474 RepID=A0ABS6H0H4_9PROT|nr:histidine phosphatase family protein [Roseomonas oleicola]MBU8542154.1 histidine phosphatase family protein [Roseomonas oleicola]
MRRRTLLAAPAWLLAPTAFAATAQGPAAAALLAALRAGGVVVVLRHGITDRRQADTGRLGDRAGQRNLSEAGRAQARRLGQSFAALGLRLGEVLTSPVFRARDTAELAFGARAVVEPRLTADDYTPDPALLVRNIAWLRDRVRQPSAPDAVDVLVGHIVPLGMMLGRGLSQAEYPEGALAVFAPGGALLGILAAETLADITRSSPASGTPPPR